MIRYHLTITIFNPFFQNKLDTRGKINSVWFYDYDYFFEKIINEMSFNEINKFKLNLFNSYKQHLSCVKICQYINGDVIDGYSIPSCEINIPSDCIAECIPNRKIRERYFEYDCLREKYYVKSSFIYYLKK